MRLDQLGDGGSAGLAGGDLGFQVGDVAVRGAGGEGAGGQRRADILLKETPVPHHRQGVEHDAFVGDGS